MTAPDLSRVFAVIPAKPVADLSSEEVFAQIVTPLLRLGRPRIDPLSLRPTSKMGIVQPKANLAALAGQLKAEYQGRESVTAQATLDLVTAIGGSAISRAAEQQLLGARGLTLAQFKADIERQEIAYPFVQSVKGVPIEHAMLVATRLAGQGISSVAGRLVARYLIVNQRKIEPAQAVELAAAQLTALAGIDGIDRDRVQEGPLLFLLPFGDARQPTGPVALRYVWRMVLLAKARGQSVPYRIWVDADDGRVRQALPLLAEASASGHAWKRDPGLGWVVPRDFEVDPSDQSGRYHLQSGPMGLRLDFGVSGDDPADYSVPDLGPGVPADFTRPPAVDPLRAGCSQGDDPFKQVHLFATIERYYDYALGLGMYAPFPAYPWTPKLDSDSLSCASYSNMAFGACPGYSAPGCPDEFPVGQGRRDNFLDYGLDNTMIAHEVGHNLVTRLSNERPDDWCGSPGCPKTYGFVGLHDLADAWADHLEDIDCTGGWVAKNEGGVDASRYCGGSRGHDEAGGLPRLHQVPMPFDVAHPGDHFPEHRSFSMGNDADYADMQIAAAALWQVREGVRSLDRASGQVQYGARLARAIRASAFTSDPGTSDLGIYQLLSELETRMLEQWATAPGGGDPAINKVAAGFAKVGLFAIPAVCIDGDSNTSDALACSIADKGEDGGDAVIDIDDADTSDDLVLDGVVHPEVDYLRIGGPAPIFHVWTGARYVFNGSSALPLPARAPCNPRFQVEVANESTFTATPTVTSPAITVSTDNHDSTACYGTWSPGPAEWAALQLAGENSRLYYRVRTDDGRGGHQRLSTMPAAGVWTVPPPSAVITSTGQANF